MGTSIQTSRPPVRDHGPDAALTQRDGPTTAAPAPQSPPTDFTPGSSPGARACPTCALDMAAAGESRCPHLPVAEASPEAGLLNDQPGRWVRGGVLRHKYYRRVWSASFISNIGNWMEMVGIQMIVAHATGSLRMLGYFAAAQLLPILVLGIFGGLVADRVNRRTLLVVTQAMLFVLAGLVAIVSYADMTWLAFAGLDFGPATGLVIALFVISLLQGTVSAFNIPAWQVLTPRLVPRDELTKAIHLNGIQFNAARVIGPAAAGLLLAWIGPTPLFVVNTITFLGVVIAVSATPDAPPPPPSGHSAIYQLKAAAAFIFGQKGPLAVFMAMVLMSFLAAPLLRMLPLYIIDVYGITDTGRADALFGWFVSVLGVGAVLGGLALKFVPAWYPKHHFIPLAIAGAGLSISLFSLTTTLWTGFIAMFFVGIFWIWGFNPAWAAMQGLVADHMRGRVLAIANVASFGVTAIGNIAAGWLGDTVAVTASKSLGTHLAVGVLSGILLIAGLIMMIFRVPEIDGFKPGEPQHGPPRRNLWDALSARAHRPPPATPRR